MDEMCQDLGMTGVLKNAGRPVWAVGLFTIAGAQGIGAGRHKKSLDLGNTSLGGRS
jgi:hypothetical protein